MYPIQFYPSINFYSSAFLVTTFCNISRSLIKWGGQIFKRCVWMIEALFESNVLCTFQMSWFGSKPTPKGIIRPSISGTSSWSWDKKHLWDKVKEGTVNDHSRKLLMFEENNCRLCSFNLCLNSCYVAHAL